MKEKWLCLPGYVGRYAVSDRGRVLSMNYRRSGLPGLLSLDSLSNGYPLVTLTAGGKCRTWTVHVLVASAFLGPRPEGMHVNHKDGIKTNNCASNLEYVTPLENIEHAFRTGLRHTRGEKNSQAKLTASQVIEVHRMLRLGLTQREIGAHFGVCGTSVSNIKRGKKWSHLGEATCL
jgi:hypothetical protein